ncbi:MAG TPA: hypothetical protein VJT73_11370, partial [Polyangiaceae bacterium]|nr:hypothetical protein [Polyangiaceae bacterium]
MLAEPTDAPFARELALARARRDEPGAVITVMASFAAFALLVIWYRHLPGGIGEIDERRLYVAGGIACPLAGVAGGFVMLQVRRRWLRRSITFPVLTALANVVYWAFALSTLRLIRPQLLVEEVFLKSGRRMIVSFLAVNVGTFVLCFLARNRWEAPRQRQMLRRWADDLHVFIPPLAAGVVALFSKYDLRRWPAVVLLALFGLFSLTGGHFETTRRSRIALDTAVVGLAAFLIYDVNYSVDYHHFGFYFAPTA